MIVWIASYPKSGNTWVRSLLATYLYSEKDFNVFENIKKIITFPNKKHFEGIFEIDKFNKDELKDKKKRDERKFEICKHWIAAQEKINLNDSVNFLKTHNIAGSVNEHDFTNADNTSGLIYVVRDPRSVAISKAHFNDISLEESINNLLDDKAFATNPGNLLEFRSSWKVNYLSWKKSPYPKIIIKYEDLYSDPFNSFKKILNFVNNFNKIDVNDLKIKKTIELCKFDNLSKLEETKGFEENTKSEKFFRKGLVDEWKTVLNEEQIEKIEKKFFEEMNELKYL